jgi:L-ascorbate metabolism protein UlaG (beta-lactamase superfamily)
VSPLIEYESLKIQWLGHAGFLINNEQGLKICIDPFQTQKDKYDSVDVIISTHEHGDHCSEDDINKFISPETEVIGIKSAESILDKLNCKSINYVNPGDKVTIKDIKFDIVHAYNINKFRSPGIPFHPKEDKKIGVVIEIDGVRVYHTGDTDLIPEMKDIQADVVLMPVSGTYVMTASEALEATDILKPKLVIPMHYGAIVGDASMAEEYKKKATVQVEIPSLDS